MIKFGFNTIAMLTEGLGIRIPWIYDRIVYMRPKVDFRNRPWGVDVIERDTGISFDAEEVEYEDKDIEFEDG